MNQVAYGGARRVRSKQEFLQMQRSGAVQGEKGKDSWFYALFSVVPCGKEDFCTKYSKSVFAALSLILRGSWTVVTAC